MRAAPRRWAAWSGELTVLGQRGVEVGDPRASAHPHRQLRRLVLHDADWGADLARPGIRSAADVPLRAPTDNRHRTRVDAADLRGEGVQIHAPSGTDCRSPQRDPDGSTFVGLATPSGSNASRRRACASTSAVGPRSARTSTRSCSAASSGSFPPC